MFATDAPYGGFVLNAVWLGVNDSITSDESIEVGVGDGYLGEGGYEFYTAWYKDEVGFAQVRVLGAGTPFNGQPVVAKVVSCRHNPQGEGCLQPWNQPAAEYEHIASINGQGVRWNPSIAFDHVQGTYTAPRFGARSASAGLESTCASYTGNPLPPSRMDATMIRKYPFDGPRP